MKKFCLGNKFLIFILLLPLFTLTAKAQIIYDGKQNIIFVGSGIKYYIDSADTQNINTIQQQKNFKTSSEKVPDFGLLKVPVWLKVQVTNKSNEPNLMLQF